MMKLLPCVGFAFFSLVLTQGLSESWAATQASASLPISLQTQLNQNSSSIFLARARKSRPKPTPAPSPTNLSAIELSVHNQVNQYRLSLGLAPLTENATITQQARSHSQAMASGQVPFGHDGFDQRVKVISTVMPVQASAENVAYNYGYSDPATMAVNGWINSPGHQVNMTGNYNKTGVGVAVSTNGTYYFTQMFVLSK